jgi:hypothetical protein
LERLSPGSIGTRYERVVFLSFKKKKNLFGAILPSKEAAHSRPPFWVATTIPRKNAKGGLSILYLIRSSLKRVLKKNVKDRDTRDFFFPSSYSCCCCFFYIL